MSLRARIFIIFSVIVLLILSVSIFLVVKNRNGGGANAPVTIPDSGNKNTNNSSGSVGGAGTVVPKGLPVKPLSSLEVEQNGVEQLAKIFIERYGTYSTDNEFENIKEVESLATKSLGQKLAWELMLKIRIQDFWG
jgi:hypothetical protein